MYWCTLSNVENLVGNTGVRERLKGVLYSSRCPHAFVIAGPRGVGKFSFVLSLARGLLKTTEEAHPDLHVIKKEDVIWSSNPALQRKKQTNIPVDLLRERMIGGTTSDGSKHGAAVYRTPVLGNKKIFIIDEAELLDESGQNSLLKILEEPPEDTVIFLVTSREDRLLQTVLSRRHPYSFGPLSADEMHAWVEQSDKRGAECDWLCEWSCGSPGVYEEGERVGVVSLYEELSAFLKDPKTVETVWVVSRIHEFLNNRQEVVLAENPNASKEAVNRGGVELVLRLFEWQSKQFLHKDKLDQNTCIGVLCSEMISDIEQQSYANISTKVLVESLVVRWKQVCSVVAGSVVV